MTDLWYNSWSRSFIILVNLLCTLSKNRHYHYHAQLVSAGCMQSPWKQTAQPNSSLGVCRVWSAGWWPSWPGPGPKHHASVKYEIYFLIFTFLSLCATHIIGEIYICISLSCLQSSSKRQTVSAQQLHSTTAQAHHDQLCRHAVRSCGLNLVRPGCMW